MIFDKKFVAASFGALAFEFAYFWGVVLVFGLGVFALAQIVMWTFLVILACAILAFRKQKNVLWGILFGGVLVPIAMLSLSYVFTELPAQRRFNELHGARIHNQEVSGKARATGNASVCQEIIEDSQDSMSRAEKIRRCEEEAGRTNEQEAAARASGITESIRCQIVSGEFSIGCLGDSSTANGPVIVAIRPERGPVGTTLDIVGRNLAGFEGDLDAWIMASDGRKGYLPASEGLYPEKYKQIYPGYELIRVRLAGSVCTVNNSYSGNPCEEYLSITPGMYAIFTSPWGSTSNSVNFEVTQ